MVDNDSMNGIYSKNPFNFQHYNVQQVGVYINGESLPGQPIKTNFSKNQFLEGYQSLFASTGKLNSDSGLDIHRDDYMNGYKLFGFDISPSICNGGHIELNKRGTLKIQLEFQKALPNTISVIVYADFDNIIKIDKYRNRIKDY